MDCLRCTVCRVLDLQGVDCVLHGVHNELSASSAPNACAVYNEQGSFPHQLNQIPS